MAFKSGLSMSKWAHKYLLLVAECWRDVSKKLKNQQPNCKEKPRKRMIKFVWQLNRKLLNILAFQPNCESDQMRTKINKKQQQLTHLHQDIRRKRQQKTKTKQQQQQKTKQVPPCLRLSEITILYKKKRKERKSPSKLLKYRSFKQPIKSQMAKSEPRFDS